MFPSFSPHGALSLGFHFLGMLHGFCVGLWHAEPTVCGAGVLRSSGTSGPLGVWSTVFLGIWEVISQLEMGIWIIWPSCFDSETHQRVGEENPPMPKWQECYTLPKSAPIGGEHVQDSLALHHNFMCLHTHIYISAQDGGFAVGWTWKFLIKSFANDLVSEHFFSGLKQSRGAMFSTPLVRSLRNCARAFITVTRPGFPCKAAAAITSTVFFCAKFCWIFPVCFGIAR